MLGTRTAAVACLLVTLAMPSASLAQSAGDNQYQDPLANPGGGGSTNGHVTNTAGGGSSGNPGSGGSGSSGAPSASPTAGSAGTTGSTTAEAASGTPKGQLPRTGFDVIVSFELGLAMLLAGLVAHRMLALRERREN